VLLNRAGLLDRWWLAASTGLLNAHHHLSRSKQTPKPHQKKVRDAIKSMLQPAMLEAEEDETQGFYTLLAVTTARHHKALGPLWARTAPLAATTGAEAVGGGEAAAALQKMLAGVSAAGAGDAKFKAYVGLLLGLINFAAKGFLEAMLASSGGGGGGELGGGVVIAGGSLEQQLCRLEDAVLVLLQVRVCVHAGWAAAWDYCMGTCMQCPGCLHGDGPYSSSPPTHAPATTKTQGCPYLLADPSQEVAEARLWRLPSNEQTAEIGRRLVLYRDCQHPVRDSAAAVLQAAWRRWARWRQSVRSQEAVGFEA